MGVSCGERTMVSTMYTPNRGDIVWITFDPRKGHEQSGRRPALVLSTRAYNQRAQLVLVCPVTSHQKGYPFEVELREKKMQGVVLADHIHSFDWKKRKAVFIQKVSLDVIDRVSGRITTLIMDNIK